MQFDKSKDFINQSEEVKEFLIVTALNEFYSEHSGMATFNALCDLNPEILDADEVWEPFEHRSPEDLWDLVDSKIDFLIQFSKDINGG